MGKEQVKISVLEMIRLNEIKVRHKKAQLDQADFIISLLKKMSTLNPNTPLEELEQTQAQLRAMINKVDDEQTAIQDDKIFVTELMERDNEKPNH